MNYKVYSHGFEISDLQKIELLQDEAVGVFESMRAYHGTVLHEAEHLRRLYESAKTVGYRPLPDLGKLHGELTAALRASGEKDTSIRLTLCRRRTFVILGARQRPCSFYRTGVVLKTAPFPRGGPHAFPFQAKSAAYQQAVLASTGSRSGAAFDWLFLDRGNSLTETRVGNFFLVNYLDPKSLSASSIVLSTPPEHLILNGVTRRFVIKCARKLGFRVQEVPITRHDFFNAAEAFLCNTSWEVLAVRELDGRTIGTGTPGPVTLKLHRLFKRRV